MALDFRFDAVEIVPKGEIKLFNNSFRNGVTFNLFFTLPLLNKTGRKFSKSLAFWIRNIHKNIVTGISISSYGEDQVATILFGCLVSPGDRHAGGPRDLGASWDTALEGCGERRNSGPNSLWLLLFSQQFCVKALRAHFVICFS